MDFRLQALGPILHWVTLVVLCVLPVLLAYVVYRLGRLPGAIARQRHHPQADAISICGWMGLLTLILWPIALVWAHLTPGKPLAGGASPDTENKDLVGKLRALRQRVATLESRLQ